MDTSQYFFEERALPQKFIETSKKNFGYGYVMEKNHVKIFVVRKHVFHTIASASPIRRALSVADASPKILSP